MSCNNLLPEILELSASVSSLAQLQLLNIESSNSLFSFAPELLSFSQSCGGELNELEVLTQCSVLSNLLNELSGSSGSSNSCLQQLLELEQLFTGNSNDIDLSNNSDLNNSDLNNSDLNNSTSVSSNSTDSSAATSTLSSSSVSSTASASATAAAQHNGKNGKEAKEGRNRKRSEVVQRSGSAKVEILSAMGLGLMFIVGLIAL